MNSFVAISRLCLQQKHNVGLLQFFRYVANSIILSSGIYCYRPYFGRQWKTLLLVSLYFPCTTEHPFNTTDVSFQMSFDSCLQTLSRNKFTIARYEECTILGYFSVMKVHKRIAQMAHVHDDTKNALESSSH